MAQGVSPVCILIFEPPGARGQAPWRQVQRDKCQGAPPGAPAAVVSPPPVPPPPMAPVAPPRPPPPRALSYLRRTAAGWIGGRPGNVGGAGVGASGTGRGAAREAGTGGRIPHISTPKKRAGGQQAKKFMVLKRRLQRKLHSIKKMTAPGGGQPLVKTFEALKRTFAQI